MLLVIGFWAYLPHALVLIGRFPSITVVFTG